MRRVRRRRKDRRAVLRLSGPRAAAVRAVAGRLCGWGGGAHAAACRGSAHARAVQLFHARRWLRHAWRRRLPRRLSRLDLVRLAGARGWARHELPPCRLRVDAWCFAASAAALPLSWCAPPLGLLQPSAVPELLLAVIHRTDDCHVPADASQNTGRDQRWPYCAARVCAGGVMRGAYSSSFDTTS